MVKSRCQSASNIGFLLYSETNDVNTGLLVEVWTKGLIWDESRGYHYIPLPEVSYSNEVTNNPGAQGPTHGSPGKKSVVGTTRQETHHPDTFDKNRNAGTTESDLRATVPKTACKKKKEK